MKKKIKPETLGIKGVNRMKKPICPRCYSADVEYYAPGWIPKWLVCLWCGHKFKE